MGNLAPIPLVLNRDSSMPLSSSHSLNQTALSSLSLSLDPKDPVISVCPSIISGLSLPKRIEFISTHQPSRSCKDASVGDWESISKWIEINAGDLLGSLLESREANKLKSSTLSRGRKSAESNRYVPHHRFALFHRQY